MDNQSRDFLRSIRPPYFDAFYFVDEVAQGNIPISPHMFFKIIFFFKGDVCYEIGSKRYEMAPGDILLAPRFTPYTCQISEVCPHHRLVIWFTEELLLSIDPEGSLLAFFKKAEVDKSGFLLRRGPERSANIFNQAFSLASERDYGKPFSDIVSYALITLILSEIYREAFLESEAEKDSEAARLVKAVYEYINNNLTKDLSLDRIAEYFYVSKFHLERTFSKHMSVTVHSYIVQRRLAFARQKLYDGMPPTQVYKSCGFSTYTTFYRAFIKRYGMSPKEFCKQASTLLACDSDMLWHALS